MTSVLVVEDSRTQAATIKFYLEKAQFEVEIAPDGLNAMRAIDRRRPDAVLTDLQMPEMDGLQLVESIRSRHSSLPVILMTANGSEQSALEALRKGAVSYVPKSELAKDVVRALRNVLNVALANQDPQQLRKCLTQVECHYELENDGVLIAPIMAHISGELSLMQTWDPTGVMQMMIALNEALDNAIYHGNLELDAELRQQDEVAYEQLAQQRRAQSPYQDRRVQVFVKISRGEVVFVVRDQGHGFDVTSLPNPQDAANLLHSRGRGLILIRTFILETRHNSQGNEITLITKVKCKS